MRAIGVTKTYPGGITALSDVNIEIEAGRVVVLLGPNGSGKSTLVHCLSGAVKPERGRLDDRDLTASTGGLRAGVICTFQIPRVFGTLTVMENCLIAVPKWGSVFAAFRVGTRLESTALDILARFGLESSRHTVSSSLSSGSARRLELARMEFACEFGAELCVLDEPSAGLDPQGIAALCKFLDRLRIKKRYVLMVEHNLEIAKLADDAYLMLDGRIVDHDAPHQLINQDHFRSAMLYGVATR